MKWFNNFILILLIVSAYSISANAKENQSAQAFFQHYLDAYNKFDAKQASEHYAASVMVSGIPGSPVVMSQEKMHGLLRNFLNQQKQKGIVKFEWETFQVHMFSDSLAIASNVAARYDRNDKLVDRASALMQAKLTDSGWKINSLTIHDHKKVLPLSNIRRETIFADALQRTDRPEGDKLRDMSRKPQQVMQFAGIEQGMTVIDLVASGGYYTEVLSHRVGEKGKVYAHNPSFILTVRDGIFNKQITQRLADNRLANVERLDKEFGNLSVYEEADAMTMILNYHDFYNQPELKRLTDLADLRTALKPNGLFLVIDSNAPSGEHQPALHRINRERTKQEIESAGFVLHKEGFFLRNTSDPLNISVFDKSIRGYTDRFVYLFKKV